MKKRGDFVSNSSSSSFIIDNCEGVDFLDTITLKDFTKIIRSLFKGVPIEGDFKIYDLKDPENKELALKEQKNHLKGWNDNMNTNIETYYHIKEIIEKYCKIGYDPYKSPLEYEHNQLETPAIQTINMLKNRMEIESLLECVSRDYARFLICFDENLIFDIPEVRDNTKNSWLTDSFTADRFVEVLQKKLWENNIDIDYRHLRYCFHGVSHMG